MDSRETIRSVDTKGMLSAVESMPRQLSEGIRVGRGSGIARFSPAEVVVCGVGGSAIGGDLLREWLGATTAICCEVCRSYSLPSHVGKGDLVIAASYSGDTEETLSMFEDAKKKLANLAVVTSGGRMEEAAKAGGVPLARIPLGVAPRASLGYLFGAMVGVLQSSGVVASDKQVEETVRILKGIIGTCKVTVATADNPAKILAHRIFPSVPVVIGHGLSAPVAKRWANQFNENSKVLSFAATLPEFDHNEIVGWMRDPRSRGFVPVLLQHDETGARMKKRIAATKDMLSRVSPVCTVDSVGTSPMAKMFSLVMMGDYASTYLGILRGEDPSSNEPIDELKATLSKK